MEGDIRGVVSQIFFNMWQRFTNKNWEAPSHVKTNLLELQRGTDIYNL